MVRTPPGPAIGWCDQFADLPVKAWTYFDLARRLTRRELEVLKLLCAGSADKEIAYELGLSTHTASNHVRHIRSKLNCATRAEAVAAALRLGIAD